MIYVIFFLIHNIICASIICYQTGVIYVIFILILVVICYPKCCNVKAVETAWVKFDENVHVYECEGQVKTTCLEPVKKGINTS